MIRTILAVGLGGFAGSVMRYAVTRLTAHVQWFNMPLGTKFAQSARLSLVHVRDQVAAGAEDTQICPFHGLLESECRLNLVYTVQLLPGEEFHLHILRSVVDTVKMLDDDLRLPPHVSIGGCLFVNRIT